MSRFTLAIPKGAFWSLLGLIIALLLFFSSLDLLGEVFKLMGEKVQTVKIKMNLYA
jgi:solute carrier family 34 (sodium-dependent phosphate cotransporter)